MRQLRCHLPIGLVLVVLACSRPKEVGSAQAMQQTSAPTGDEDEIDNAQAVLGDYRRALLAHDSDRARALVTASTFEVYSRIGALSFSAPKERLRKAPLSQQVFALTLRARGALADEAPTGGKLFEDSVANGWSDAGSLSKMRVVKVVGDTAFVRTSENVLEFDAPVLRRERGQWRVDLPTLLGLSDRALEKLLSTATRHGGTRDNAVKDLVAASLKTKLGDEIWVPPSQR